MPRDLHQRRVNCSALSIYPGPTLSEVAVIIWYWFLSPAFIEVLSTLWNMGSRSPPGHVKAVYVNLNEDATQQLKEKWLTWGEGAELVVLQSPYRSLTRPLLKYIERVSKQSDNLMVTVLLPEFVPAKWWHQLLHNQSSLLLKGALLFRKGVIVTSVPYHLEK